MKYSELKQNRHISQAFPAGEICFIYSYHPCIVGGYSLIFMIHVGKTHAIKWMLWVLFHGCLMPFPFCSVSRARCSLGFFSAGETTLFGVQREAELISDGEGEENGREGFSFPIGVFFSIVDEEGHCHDY